MIYDSMLLDELWRPNDTVDIFVTRAIRVEDSDRRKSDRLPGETLDDGRIKLSQPQLARHIYEDLGFQENTKAKKILAASSKILKRFQTSYVFDNSFNYRSIVGNSIFTRSARGCFILTSPMCTLY